MRERQHCAGRGRQSSQRSAARPCAAVARCPPRRRGHKRPADHVCGQHWAPASCCGISTPRPARASCGALPKVLICARLCGMHSGFARFCARGLLRRACRSLRGSVARRRGLTGGPRRGWGRGRSRCGEERPRRLALQAGPRTAPAGGRCAVRPDVPSRGGSRRHDQRASRRHRRGKRRAATVRAGRCRRPLSAPPRVPTLPGPRRPRPSRAGRRTRVCRATRSSSRPFR